MVKKRLLSAVQGNFPAKMQATIRELAAYFLCHRNMDGIKL